MRTSSSKVQRLRNQKKQDLPHNPEVGISEDSDTESESDSYYLQDEKQQNDEYYSFLTFTSTLSPRERECQDVNTFRTCYLQHELDLKMKNQPLNWGKDKQGNDTTPRDIAINLEQVRAFLCIPFEYGQTCIHKPDSIKTYIGNLRRLLFFMAGAKNQLVTLDRLVDMHDAPVLVRAYIEHRLNLRFHKRPSDKDRYVPHDINPYGTYSQLQPASLINYLKALLQGVKCFVQVQQYKQHPLLNRTEGLIAQLGAIGATKDIEHKGLNFWILQCIRAREVEAFKLHKDYISYTQKNGNMSKLPTLYRLQSIVLIILLTSMPVLRPAILRQMSWSDLKEDKTNNLQYISTKKLSHKTKDRYGWQNLPIASLATKWLNILKTHRLDYIRALFIGHPSFKNADISKSDLDNLPILIFRKRPGTKDILGTHNGKLKLKITPRSSNAYNNFVSGILKNHIVYKDNRHTNRQRTGLGHHARRKDFDSWIATINSEKQETRSVPTAERLYTSTDSDYQEWVQRKKWLDPFIEYFHTQQAFDPSIFKVDINGDLFWDLKALADVKNMKHLVSQIETDVNEKKQVSHPKALSKTTEDSKVDLTNVLIQSIQSSSVVKIEDKNPELNKYCKNIDGYSDCNYIHARKLFVHNRYTITINNKTHIVTCRDRENLVETKNKQTVEHVDSNIEMFKQWYQKKMPTAIEMDIELYLVKVTWVFEDIFSESLISFPSLIQKTWAFNGKDAWNNGADQQEIDMTKFIGV
jgi:hypothetical protein